MLAFTLSKTSHLLKNFSLCQKSLPFLSSFRRKISTNSPNFEQFGFVINKFNDVHIKQENIVNFSEQTNKSKEKFENALKSNKFF